MFPPELTDISSDSPPPPATRLDQDLLASSLPTPSPILTERDRPVGCRRLWSFGATSVRPGRPGGDRTSPRLTDQIDHSFQPSSSSVQSTQCFDTFLY